MALYSPDYQNPASDMQYDVVCDGCIPGATLEATQKEWKSSMVRILGDPVKVIPQSNP